MDRSVGATEESPAVMASQTDVSKAATDGAAPTEDQDDAGSDVDAKDADEQMQDCNGPHNAPMRDEKEKNSSEQETLIPDGKFSIHEYYV